MQCNQLYIWADEVLAIPSVAKASYVHNDVAAMLYVSCSRCQVFYASYHMRCQTVSNRIMEMFMNTIVESFLFKKNYVESYVGTKL